MSNSNKVSKQRFVRNVRQSNSMSRDQKQANMQTSDKGQRTCRLFPLIKRGVCSILDGSVIEVLGKGIEKAKHIAVLLHFAGLAAETKHGYPSCSEDQNRKIAS
jgi:hypothetical protein